MPTITLQTPVNTLHSITLQHIHYHHVSVMSVSHKISCASLILPSTLDTSRSSHWPSWHYTPSHSRAHHPYASSDVHALCLLSTPSSLHPSLNMPIQHRRIQPLPPHSMTKHLMQSRQTPSSLPCCIPITRLS
jgi:hypothetical protein